MNTKQIGERAEALVIAELLRAGKVVLQPFGDNQRYDIVVDDRGAFIRIQVKTARIIDGAVDISTCSTYGHRGRETRGYKGEADLFMAYCPVNNKVYVVPVGAVGSRGVRLRLLPSKNNQEKRVRRAKDFEFNCWVAQSVEHSPVKRKDVGS